MWPSMFGPGWGWGVLVVLGVVALTGLLLVWAAHPGRSRAAGPLDEGDLWHRYEEGDLTREEFERLRRRRAA